MIYRRSRSKPFGHCSHYTHSSSINLCHDFSIAFSITSTASTAAAARATTAPASPLASATTAVITTPARRGLLFPLRDGEGAPKQHSAIQRGNSREALLHLLHVHESKAARSSVLVHHHIHADDVAIRFEQICQVVLRRVERKVTHIGPEVGANLSWLACSQTILHFLRIFDEVHIVREGREACDRLKPFMIAVRAAHAPARS
mmetsp:Transcript_23976/g.32646  ORF Transcript_23976/g.32646 Transcript_23976/m.32646 type:complete len:203 (+) Transcript_23976:126-734(+)